MRLWVIKRDDRVGSTADAMLGAFRPARATPRQIDDRDAWPLVLVVPGELDVLRTAARALAATRWHPHILPAEGAAQVGRPLREAAA